MFIADIPPPQVPVITQAITTEKTVGRNSESVLRRMESDETIRRNALRLSRPTRAEITQGVGWYLVLIYYSPKN
jgi:hypothetical protein